MRPSPITTMPLALAALACSGHPEPPATAPPKAPASAAPQASMPPEAPSPRARRVTEAGGLCLPQVASTGGWLAGDGGRSVAIPDGRLVHLFGDTLIGPVDGSDQRAVTFVGNTIGVAVCGEDGWSVDFHWRDDGENRAAFFDVEGEHVWLSEGFVVEGRLHVILAKIERVDYGLKFAYAGSFLATVDNPEAHPDEWNVTYAPLATSRDYRPTKGATVHDGHVYLYSEVNLNEYPEPVILLRLPVGGLEAPQDNLEYLAVDRSWKPMSAWTREDSFTVADAAGPTMFVHHHPGVGRWLTVGVDPEDRWQMIIQTADALEGPWVRGPVIYEFPEMVDADREDPEIACYAVTEHPQLRLDDGNTLVVTYSCNSTKGLVPSPDDLDFYYPKTLTVDIRSMTGAAPSSE